MLKTLCFMRLKTAGMVVGWLGIVASLLSTIGSAIIVGNVEGICDSLVGNRYQSEYTETYMIIIIIFSLLLAFSVIELLSTSMLVLGIVKERHLLLLPWISCNGIFLFLTIISKSILIVAELFSDIGRIFPIIIITIPLLAFRIYIFYGIYSLYKQIKIVNDEERPLIKYEKNEYNSSENGAYSTYLKI